MTDYKQFTFESIEEMLMEQGFNIVSKDFLRPWGGFFVIDEKQTTQFAEKYFQEVDITSIQLTQKMSPKILLVAPNKRLSWQYHNRRAEIWKCIGGKVEVVTSDTDEEKDRHFLLEGDGIKLYQGQRHRLIGTDAWGIVAEIWLHSDSKLPSDENDIVRVQDDFGR